MVVSRIKLILASLFAIAFTLMPAVAVHAQNVNTQCGVAAGVNFDPTQITGANCTAVADDGTATTTVGNIARTVINIFTWVVGVVSVVMIIVGGFKYITSGGDSSNVSGAKNTILFALVGLVVVILAQIIVRFVLANVSTTNG